MGSLTLAAKHLNVTQSAVSRQIGTLEGYLQVQLFRRERQGVILTPAGQAYHSEIAPAFEAIASATSKLVNSGREQPPQVRVYPTFAAKWLIPRLPRFNAEFPAIEVKVATGTQPVDFSKESFDLVIQLLPSEEKLPNRRILFSDIIQPVCAPVLLSGSGRALKVEELPRYRRLISRYRRGDWSDWLSAVGLPDTCEAEMEFPSSLLTYQAVREGMGIAIGQVRFLEQDFANGSMIPLFQPVERKLAYFALWSPSREPNRKVRTFLSWLEREASIERAKDLAQAR